MTRKRLRDLPVSQVRDVGLLGEGMKDQEQKDQNKGEKQVLPYLTVKDSPKNV